MREDGVRAVSRRILADQRGAIAATAAAIKATPGLLVRWLMSRPGLDGP